jgi:hypothetical protein
VAYALCYYRQLTIRVGHTVETDPRWSDVDVTIANRQVVVAKAPHLVDATTAGLADLPQQRAYIRVNPHARYL